MDTLIYQTLYLDIFIKCALALIAGGLIGMERKEGRKHAGIKAHVLISLGTAILTLLSIHLSLDGNLGLMAAQIILGVGVIGSVAVFISREKEQGILSAAALFVTGSIGISIGAGLFFLAFLALSFVVSIFYFLSPHPNLEKKMYVLNIEIVEWDSLDEIAHLMKHFDLQVEDKNLEKKEQISLQLTYHTTAVAQALFMKKLFHLEGVGRIVKI